MRSCRNITSISFLIISSAYEGEEGGRKGGKEGERKEGGREGGREGRRKGGRREEAFTCTNYRQTPNQWNNKDMDKKDWLKNSNKHYNKT